MKFSQRFAYYLVGLTIGSFFVALVFMGKKTQCAYFPNSRVLSHLRSKPMLFDIEASRRLAEDWVDTVDVRNTLEYGEVDFEKSNVPDEGGKRYVIYGQTRQRQPITLEIINYSDKSVLHNIIKRKKNEP